MPAFFTRETSISKPPTDMLSNARRIAASSAPASSSAATSMSPATPAWQSRYSVSPSRGRARIASSA